MTKQTGSNEQSEISAQFARDWWKTLMSNACALLDDAATLVANGSPGRAQSLLVLSMEELAKARWLYLASDLEWSAPLGLYGQTPRDSLDVVLPRQLLTSRLPHHEKLTFAEQYASGLGGFWHVDRREEYYFPEDLSSFEGAARRRNLDKQAGLYVDREGEALMTPLAIPEGGVVEFLIHAAQCIEMHLIEDHTRQQDAPDPTRIDSVQELHWRILQYAHPDEFEDFVNRISTPDSNDGVGDRES